MKQKMTKYLKTIGITKLYLKKVRGVFDFYSDFIDEDILDIFVEDYIDGEGVRNYDSLLLFTQNYIMEAASFLTQDDFDIVLLKNQVVHIKVTKENFDFKKADDKSRMSVEVKLQNGLYCSFKASKGNCDYLRNIVLKHINPNIKSNA